MPIEISVTQRTQITATLKKLLSDEYSEEITDDEAKRVNRAISTKLTSRFRPTDLVNSVIKREAKKEIKKYLEKREKEQENKR